MLQKSLILLAIVAACGTVQAQSTPAKKELVGKILKLQQPGIEAMARGLTEEPAARMWSRAAQALPQRVAPEKQEAVALEIQEDIKKYVESTVPLVRDRAIRLAPTTVGALLEEKFTEDELKQVLAMLENPVYVKFQLHGGDMQKVLADKLVTDARPQVEPKVRALEETIARRLGVTASSGGAAPAAAPKASAKK
ncbi:hypothetical protein FN976_16295 [Caenimonas sedimenti]|uniref:DUF2059 domain-containing protein n=1 Tax=Caenimonas sedimenti TaxID=2596921 RepID=A0A562ZNG9_9BURK|nr:hypothetical protein [Caenimonas sedimenti]TWO69911.1 hypothetical protein FN976_16295 [Caenimonas sedimenti]